MLEEYVSLLIPITICSIVSCFGILAIALIVYVRFCNDQLRLKELEKQNNKKEELIKQLKRYDKSFFVSEDYLYYLIHKEEIDKSINNLKK